MTAARFVSVLDSHTAGHPTRVVTAGIPPLIGSSVAELRDVFRAAHDDLRRFLLHEPRGHAAMFGVVPVSTAAADFGAFFMGSYGYLDMCGHATIGLARTLQHLGVIAPGQASFRLEVPAGIVTVRFERNDDGADWIGFDNLDAFVAREGVELDLFGRPVVADIAYGGNWYGLVRADAAGVTLEPSGVAAACLAGAELKAQANRGIAAGAWPGCTHQLDSILFWSERREGTCLVSRHLVVLETNKFDRSPCGTGTSARLAQLRRCWAIGSGEVVLAEGVLGTRFRASCFDSVDGAVRPSVLGQAHMTGVSTFLLEAGDPLPNGFLCR